MMQQRGNRGMAFEMLISYSNAIYQQKGIALITKRPTPMKVIRPSNVRGQQIAVFEKPSTVDYTGVYRGHAIEFEAKSTHIETNWPLKDIHEHQVEHLQKVHQHGGIAFILVEFTAKRTIFFLPTEHLLKVWNEAKAGGRKSIQFSDFEKYGVLLRRGRGTPLDYLAAVDQIIREDVTG